MFSLRCRNANEGKGRECRWEAGEDGQGTGNNEKNNVCVCVNVTVTSTIGCTDNH